MRAIFFTALLCFAGGYAAGFGDGLAKTVEVKTALLGLSY